MTIAASPDLEKQGFFSRSFYLAGIQRMARLQFIKILNSEAPKTKKHLVLIGMNRIKQGVILQFEEKNYSILSTPTISFVSAL
ncbi:hypothetical protein [Flavobacterium sp. XN-5]|uniref:hypothetical protein n=1 Tax=Flavobacterium sp. XN-5 TaxID=2599390 RepID=UPI0011C7FAB7|nr:hypothetical protein [Flavobacterium sp. XN-5]